MTTPTSKIVVQLEQLGLFDALIASGINSAKKVFWVVILAYSESLMVSRVPTVATKIYHSAIDNHLVANISGEFCKTMAGTGSAAQTQAICPPIFAMAWAPLQRSLVRAYIMVIVLGLASMSVQCRNCVQIGVISELKLPFWIMWRYSDNESYWQPKLSIGSQYDINQTNAIRVTKQCEWLPKSDNIDNVDEVGLNGYTILIDFLPPYRSGISLQDG